MAGVDQFPMRLRRSSPGAKSRAGAARFVLNADNPAISIRPGPWRPCAPEDLCPDDERNLGGCVPRGPRSRTPGGATLPPATQPGAARRRGGVNAAWHESLAHGRPAGPPFFGRAKPETHNTSQNRRPTLIPERGRTPDCARQTPPDSGAQRRENRNGGGDTSSDHPQPPAATPGHPLPPGPSRAGTGPFEERRRPPRAEPVRPGGACWLMKWSEGAGGQPDRGMPLMRGQSR